MMPEYLAQEIMFDYSRQRTDALRLGNCEQLTLQELKASSLV